MKFLIFGTLAFVLFISIYGCKKDNSEITNTKRIVITNGIYKGVFKTTDSLGTQEGEITLKLENGSYECSRNPNKIPAGGSGTFSVDNDSNIQFLDMNIWSNDFDSYLVLSKIYRYRINDKHLKIFAKRVNNVYYEYELVRL